VQLAEVDPGLVLPVADDPVRQRRVGPLQQLALVAGLRPELVLDEGEEVGPGRAGLAIGLLPALQVRRGSPGGRQGTAATTRKDGT
jgi:hypothetical protein